MSSIYSLEVTEEGGKRRLKFGGDLIINHIDKMTAEVKDALPQPADVAIVLDNPSNIDGREKGRGERRPQGAACQCRP